MLPSVAIFAARPKANTISSVRGVEIERKRLQVEHAAAKSERAKILKLADKTSNLISLVNSPPTDWSLQRKREYLDWALEVAKGLRGVNAWLEAQFDEAAEHLTKRLQTSDEARS